MFRREHEHYVVIFETNIWIFFSTKKKVENIILQGQ